MKAALILAAFAAVAAAAPSGGSPWKRCGGGSKDTCVTGEICVGEYGFKDDPKGLCMKQPVQCGASLADPDTTCPRNNRCIPRANVALECPQDVAYCGYCVERSIVSKLGVRSEGVNRCGGSSGKKCFKNPASPELCAGENELRDGMGVCLTWGFTRQCKDGCFSEFTGDVCVSNTCPPPSVLMPEDCSGKVCLPKQFVDQFGLKKPFSN